MFLKVCPRALLLLGNPDYEWLADGSMLVSAKAAKEVWKSFGIGDRMGWSIVAGHGHCHQARGVAALQRRLCDQFRGQIKRKIGPFHILKSVPVFPLFSTHGVYRFLE